MFLSPLLQPFCHWKCWMCRQINCIVGSAALNLYCIQWHLIFLHFLLLYSPKTVQCFSSSVVYSLVDWFDILVWFFSNKIHLFPLGFVHIDFKLVGFTTNQIIIESLMLSYISIWKTWWHLTPPYVSRYIFHWMGERVQAYFCILCDQ